MWYGEGYGLARPEVEKVGGSGESFGPIGRRHMSLEEERASNVVEGAKSTFGLAVLLRSVRARET
jgi:hypothetical protein